MFNETVAVPGLQGSNLEVTPFSLFDNLWVSFYGNPYPK